MQMQRSALSFAVPHPSQIGLDSPLRALACRFPIDVFYNQKPVAFCDAPFAGHLELGKGGVEGLEASALDAVFVNAKGGLGVGAWV